MKPRVTDIAEHIFINVHTRNKPLQSHGHNIFTWGMTGSSLTTLGFKLFKVPWTMRVQTIKVLWDREKDGYQLDTLLHEFVHVLEFIFGIKRTHGKRFWRILKFLKKEFQVE